MHERASNICELVFPWFILNADQSPISLVTGIDSKDEFTEKLLR